MTDFSSFATYTPTSPFLSPESTPSNPLSSSNATVRPNRPTTPALPPRSSLLPSVLGTGGGVIRANSRPSSLAGSTRPYSPPTATTTKRFPSPTTLRARSVMSTKTQSNPRRAGEPHPQSHSSLHSHQHSSSHHSFPTATELASFALLCRQLYYEKDSNAAYQVDQILKKLPSASKTAYARTMANVRSQFHADEARRTRELVVQTLDRSGSGTKVMEALRIAEGGIVAMRSSKARRVRKEGVIKFLKEHAVRTLPGTQPFVRSLFAVLYLQGLQGKKGGAGRRRVEWEVDVAVFSEAAGGEWMKESIELLKGLLGFTETIKEPPVESYFDDEEGEEDGRGNEEVRDEDSAGVASPPFGPMITSDDSTDDEEESEEIIEEKSLRLPPRIPPHRVVSSSSSTTPSSSSTITSPTTSTPTSLVTDHGEGGGFIGARSRAASDPFLDPADRERRLNMTGIVISKNPLSSPTLSSSETEEGFKFASTSEGESSSSPSSPPSRPRRIISPTSTPPPINTTSSSLVVVQPEVVLEPQYRIFTVASYLTDPELDSLARLFPDFITARSNPIVQKRRAPTPRELEEGRGETDGGVTGEGSGVVKKIGHGEIRIGQQSRDDGFTGTGWQRFRFWWRRLLRRN